MAQYKHLSTPLSDELVLSLNAGDLVRLSGYIYTARDVVHKKLSSLIKNKGKLPFDLKGQVIFYSGPTPPRPGRQSGAVGPTTSSRMDKYTPLLLENGLKGTIGKGRRSSEVVQAIEKNNSVYFGAPGGVAALVARSVISSQIVAYPEYGPEALRIMEVRDLPLVVINDSYGGDLFTDQNKTC